MQLIAPSSSSFQNPHGSPKAKISWQASKAISQFITHHRAADAAVLTDLLRHFGFGLCVEFHILCASNWFRIVRHDAMLFSHSSKRNAAKPEWEWRGKSRKMFDEKKNVERSRFEANNKRIRREKDEMKWYRKRNTFQRVRAMHTCAAAAVVSVSSWALLNWIYVGLRITVVLFCLSCTHTRTKDRMRSYARALTLYIFFNVQHPYLSFIGARHKPCAGDTFWQNESF